jgi:hypothetical protein
MASRPIRIHYPDLVSFASQYVSMGLPRTSVRRVINSDSMVSIAAPGASKGLGIS